MTPLRHPRRNNPADAAPVPLSHASIWDDQRQYFVQAGIDAWRHNVVPSYVTNNPFIAHAYAEILRGYLQDLKNADALPADGRPVHIVELGAGCGRFAYFLLKALFGDQARGAPLPPIRYVMTDVVRANVDFWRAHERFAPYFESGLLDVALYDPEQHHGIDLEVAGVSLGPGCGPMAVIANYVFDGVPHDVFRVERGGLQEGLVSLVSPQDSGPAALAEAKLVYEFHPCRGSYYGDPDCDAILADYAQLIPEGAFSMPVAAVGIVAKVRELAGDRLLLLAGDKAYTELMDLCGRPPPQPISHGSISFTVNFHALAAWALRTGAHALVPGRTTPLIAVMGLLFGTETDEGAATHAAYAAHVRQFGPSDFFVLRHRMLTNIDALGMTEILSLLRLAGADSRTLMHCYERIVALLPQVRAAERRDLRDQLLAGWAQYLPLQEEMDFAFHIGSLLGGAGFPADAAPFLHESLATHGHSAAAVSNLALCEEALAISTIMRPIVKGNSDLSDLVPSRPERPAT